jgi:hypothetical protein
MMRGHDRLEAIEAMRAVPSPDHLRAVASRLMSDAREYGLGTEQREDGYTAAGLLEALADLWSARTQMASWRVVRDLGPTVPPNVPYTLVWESVYTLDASDCTTVPQALADYIEGV